MAIQVAIQSNIRFSEVTKDDNNNVVLNITQGEEVDALQALTTGGNLGGQEAARILVWALKGKGYGDSAIEGKRIIEHINEYRGFFNEILLQYYTTSELKWETMFANTDVKTGEDIEKLSASEIEKVGNNITSYFMEKMNNADLTRENRVKFYRSSETKNFITLKPNMFMKFGKEQPNGFRRSWTVPFIESMDIPENLSKLSYSDYEKGVRADGSKGLDLSDATPSKADAAPAAPKNDDMPF
jgi:hypothetical protein